jgi:hypothetical protein
VDANRKLQGSDETEEGFGDSAYRTGMGSMLLRSRCQPEILITRERVWNC